MPNISNTRGASRDPRARRTRALLRAAVLELSTEKDLDGITMGDIAERAEVNRATVYLHYKDREDLLLDATESTMEGIVDAASACRLLADEHSLSDDAPVHLVNLFTHVDRHRAIYRRMLGEDGSSRFAGRLERLLAQAWFEQLLTEAAPGGFDETALLLRAHFLSGAMLSVISRWTRGDFDAVGNEKSSEEGGALGIERIAQLTWSMIRGQV
ncbi:TetR family transcriptional regulator [Streptomyces sp. 2132.2]|uniref:TetR/AcrR family transcriptional regulator n=1 Tax=Streptomyces TaxID=1883 RepID=UPI000F4AC027|nr:MULTISPECIES: TetR/AcrR family transcriptional regulator [unclassified Streptomyces]ROQ89040.1 TetR family transcriptional regulator [Streptomyces sp. 2132.2]WSI29261.1 TetR/AcrR family transcriptional regulator [Streptomyces sp. NBC_01343]